MKIKINTITALRALKRNRLRSCLSIIGIIIGISSVIAMIGLGSSAKIAVEEKVQSYGTNALAVLLRRHKNFDAGDLNVIKNYIPQIKYITPMMYIGEKEKESIHRYGKKNCRARLYFCSEDYFKIQDRSAAEGRLFTDKDVASSAKVVVIGSSVKEKLFGREDPVGKIITISSFPFTVIGVMNKKGSALSGRDFDSMSVFPYTSGLQRFMNTALFDEIHMSTSYGYEVAPAAKAAEKYVIRKFFPGAKTGDRSLVKITTSDDKLKMAKYITTALSALLAGIASISLFVGGVGIMNIMLVSVTERTREIGIRMAIGAKKNDIMLQFLFESFFLSTVGGIIGILAGLGLYYLVCVLVDWVFIFSPMAIIIAFVFSAAVGIFFGYYPSKKAAELKPIEALKYE